MEGLLEQSVWTARSALSGSMKILYRHPKSGCFVVPEEVRCAVVPRLDQSLVINGQKGILVSGFQQ